MIHKLKKNKLKLFKFRPATTLLVRSFSLQNEELMKKRENLYQKLQDLSIKFHAILNNGVKSFIKNKLKKNPLCVFEPAIRKEEKKHYYSIYKKAIKEEEKLKKEIIEEEKKIQFKIKSINHKLDKIKMRIKRKTEIFFLDKNYKKERRKEIKMLNSLALYNWQMEEDELAAEIRDRTSIRKRSKKKAKF